MRNSHLFCQRLDRNRDIEGRYLHPAHPWTPRMCRIPNAMKDVAMVVRDKLVQKRLYMSVVVHVLAVKDSPETCWKFPTCVKVRQPKNDIWYETALISQQCT